jgi:hypothetical protein
MATRFARSFSVDGDNLQVAVEDIWASLFRRQVTGTIERRILFQKRPSYDADTQGRSIACRSRVNQPDPRNAPERVAVARFLSQPVGHPRIQ